MLYLDGRLPFICRKRLRPGQLISIVVSQERTSLRLWERTGIVETQTELDLVLVKLVC